MELHQLESFVAVAEEGNMTRAANRLHVSQPAVSAQVKMLEEELGIALFTRTPRGMTLTPEGERLKLKADSVLRGLDNFRNEAATLRGVGHGTVTLGVNTDPRILRLKDIHGALSSEHPGISLVVKETMSWETAEHLLARTIDMGFSYTPPDDRRIEAHILEAIDLVIVAPSAWRKRLAGKDVGRLADFPWIWTSDHCPMNAPLHDLFASIGRQPDKAVIVDQESAITKLVTDEVGLSIMPAIKAAALAPAEGIFPVMHLEQKLHLHLLFLGRRKEEQCIMALTDAIRKVWA